MQDRKLPLTQHLNEIRKRLILSSLSIVICSAVTYTQIDRLLDLLIKPVERLAFISIHEAFVVHLKLALVGGIVLSSPIIIYHTCKFIWTALYRAEKRVFIIYGALSLFLFILGCLFSFFIMLPIVTRFLLSFQRPDLVPMISIDKFVSYLTFLLLTFSIIFELPLVMMFFTRLKLIDPVYLAAKRRYIIVSVFIIGAILTPPDVFTQFLMAVPLLILFEISLFFSRFIKRRTSR